MQTASLPVHFQMLCESSKLYDPGQQYASHVGQLQRDEEPDVRYDFEPHVSTNAWCGHLHVPGGVGRPPTARRGWACRCFRDPRPVPPGPRSCAPGRGALSATPQGRRPPAAPRRKVGPAMARLPRSAGVSAGRGWGGGGGGGVASLRPLSPHRTHPLPQVGVDTRCTSRGPPPCQTRRASWTPALAQVKGPVCLAAGGGEQPGPGGGLAVQAGLGTAYPPRASPGEGPADPWPDPCGLGVPDSCLLLRGLEVASDVLQRHHVVQRGAGGPGGQHRGVSLRAG